jgi:hypothetical protein
MSDRLSWIVLRRAISGIVIVASLILVVAFYFSYLHWINIKTGSTGWIGSVHKLDAALGYVPIPCSNGMTILSKDVKIPVYYDCNGFRIASVGSPGQLGSPRSHVDSLLALGCSFTFGFGVPSEHTYCSQLAKKMGVSPLNAGRCSYGLAEMVTLARQIIPAFKPKTVLVQYSPWLVDRSRLRYAPSFFGLLPHPYFVSGPEGSIKIHRPDFMSAIFDLDFEVFRHSHHTFGDFLNFSLSRKFPSIAHDLLHSSLVRLKESLALVPTPEQDTEKIVRSAYLEIESICSRHGSNMVIVVLGMDNTLTIVPESFKKLKSKMVDSQAVLIDRLKTSSMEEYAKAYYHWGKNPSAIIDRHPNIHAHEIIAESVLSETSF